MKRLLSFIVVVFVVVSCSDSTDNFPHPEVQDQRQELLDVMDHTAKLVSQVLASSSARNEILDYATVDHGGEVVARFDELLTGQASQRSTAGGVATGKFAELFRPRAKQFAFETREEKSSSVDNIVSDLENYLKQHGLALYGPYLAENHSNSTKPITVSFDPLDDTKTTNVGYMFVPKANSGSSANSGGLDAPMNWDEFELVDVGLIDDDYAYDNPVIVIIPDGGSSGGTTNPNPNPGGSSSTTPTPLPNNGIECSNLMDGDLLLPYMERVRLTDNLRSGFWNRNIIDLYAITKDDLTFDLNNDPQINTSIAKVYTGLQISRKDARDKKWKSIDQLLDGNWKLDEDNLFLAASYKKVDVSIEEINVKVKGIFTSKPSGEVSAKLKFEEKRELLYSFDHDKCATIGLYKTASPKGLEQSRRIEGFGKFEYTIDIEWYR